MNVRLGEGAVRFRISCEELERLLAGKKLMETLVFSAQRIVFTIDPSGEDMATLFEDGHLGLSVSRLHLDTLNKKGRQKNGIVKTIDGIALSLQVDLKTYPRAKPA